MSLFVNELDAFTLAFEAGIATVAIGDLDALARLAADGFLARPRFCALLAILAGVLEQNVSEDKIIRLKRDISVQNARIAAAIHARLPGASLADCGWAAASTATFVAGLWPSARGSRTAEKVLAMPEFTHLKPQPERDLARVVRALLASIVRA